MRNFISFILQGANVIFKGLGQIFLQEYALTGLLIFLGIGLNSWVMAFGAVLGSGTGMGTAYLFKFNKAQIEQGIFGFSPALVGVAFILFFKTTIWIWLFILIGSVVAAVLQHLFLRLKLPVFTFPFVLVTWGGWYLFTHIFPVAGSEFMNHPLPIPGHDLFFGLRGIGQVIFQDYWLTGLVFFIGLFLHSHLAALYALAGSLAAALMANALGSDIQDIQMGLLSFNAVLCAIVFAGEKLIDGLWVLASVLVSVLLSSWMMRAGWLQLTFPFVASAFVFSLLKNRFKAYLKG